MLFFIFNTKAYSEVVNKLETEGNQRITAETISIFADIILGKDYKPSDINSLIKKLYETNFFSNITVELNDGVLKIIVEENPIINTIVINGEPAKKYITAINELLSNKEKSKVN